MNKKLIIKFIEKCTSADEDKQVLNWISKCSANEDYYISLKNLYVSQNLSNKRANALEIKEIIDLTVNKDKIKAKENKLSIYKFTSIAAGVLLIVSIGINIVGSDKIFNSKHNGALLTANDIEIQEDSIVTLASLPSESKNYYYTVKGVKARLELPDGSVVWLNSDSKLTYPNKFEGPTREVEISGEALFEVVKNPKVPMLISTNKNFKIKVFGTTFNVRSYDNDDKAITTLYDGKIELITRNNKGSESVIPILPNQVYEVLDSGLRKPSLVKLENPRDQSAWQDGRIIFDNTPLSEVIKTLERWHGTIFDVKDSSILAYTITATFRSESIVQIMNVLRYCALIDYEVDDNKVILTARK